MAEEERYDAIIVGAGFSGIHQLIHLRKRGLRCAAIDAGSNFGGTWNSSGQPYSNLRAFLARALEGVDMVRKVPGMEGTPSARALPRYLSFACPARL
ncbi:hypothetical protein JVU11DRAFT_5966 [Chiua virens]|nr:hypothetical protein JVU11DRAFT_5966 [Chiua virens]